MTNTTKSKNTTTELQKNVIAAYRGTLRAVSANIEKLRIIQHNFMFPSDDFWQSPVFGALIGALITLLGVKVWENQRAEREEREKKLPSEHDERF